MAPPASISPTLLAQIIKTPPELLEQIFIDLYPPNFLTDDDWIKKFRSTFHKQKRAYDLEGKGLGNTSSFEENLGYVLPNTEWVKRIHLPGGRHASLSRTLAWESVKEADEALLYLLKARPELEPCIDRIMAMHIQREGGAAAKETKERLREPGKRGWKLLIQEHKAQLCHVNGRWKDRKATWDYQWRILGDTARAKMVTASMVEDFGERTVDYLLHVASEKGQVRRENQPRIECGELGTVESCLARKSWGGIVDVHVI